MSNVKRSGSPVNVRDFKAGAEQLVQSQRKLKRSNSVGKAISIGKSKRETLFDTIKKLSSQVPGPAEYSKDTLSSFLPRTTRFEDKNRN